MLDHVLKIVSFHMTCALHLCVTTSSFLPGVIGPQGSKGEDGVNGFDGQSGAKGEPGLPGPQGETLTRTNASVLARFLSFFSLNISILQDPEDTLAHRDQTVFRVKWVSLARPPWSTASW